VAKAKKLLANDLKGKKIGILGLSFKPDTDDMRDAPSLIIIKELVAQGAEIATFDPIAVENAKKLLKAEKNITFVKDSYEAATDADLLIVVTEWNEFRQLDLAKIKKLMKSPNLVDGRNIYEPEQAKALGFTYLGVGR
jgi:UDPglucose 6-dehydrogenase